MHTRNKGKPLSVKTYLWLKSAWSPHPPLSPAQESINTHPANYMFFTFPRQQILGKAIMLLNNTENRTKHTHPKKLIGSNKKSPTPHLD